MQTTAEPLHDEDVDHEEAKPPVHLALVTAYKRDRRHHCTTTTASQPLHHNHGSTTTASQSQELLEGTMFPAAVLLAVPAPCPALPYSAAAIVVLSAERHCIVDSHGNIVCC